MAANGVEGGAIGIGSKVVLNYWAAFEFDAANKRCEGQ